MHPWNHLLPSLRKWEREREREKEMKNQDKHESLTASACHLSRSYPNAMLCWNCWAIGPLWFLGPRARGQRPLQRSAGIRLVDCDLHRLLLHKLCMNAVEQVAQRFGGASKNIWPRQSRTLSSSLFPNATSETWEAQWEFWITRAGWLMRPVSCNGIFDTVSGALDPWPCCT